MDKRTGILAMWWVLGGCAAQVEPLAAVRLAGTTVQDVDPGVIEPSDEQASDPWQPARPEEARELLLSFVDLAGDPRPGARVCELSYLGYCNTSDEYGVTHADWVLPESNALMYGSLADGTEFRFAASVGVSKRQWAFGARRVLDHTELHSVYSAAGRVPGSLGFTTVELYAAAGFGMRAGATVSLAAASEEYAEAKDALIIHADRQGRPDLARTETSTSGLVFILDVPESNLTLTVHDPKAACKLQRTTGLQGPDENTALLSMPGYQLVGPSFVCAS